MSLFSSLFGTKKENPNNIKKAILSYCYGNMLSLSDSNIEAFINTYKNNPTKALKARLFSAALTHAGISIDQNSITDLDAKFLRIDSYRSILLFNFYAYGGFFQLNGSPAISPSYVGIVYNNDFSSKPSYFFLEPSIEPGSAMLIKILPDLTRLNLGDASGNNEHAFVNDIIEVLGSESNYSQPKTSSLDLAENAFCEESGMNIDKMPEGEALRERFYSLGEGLSLEAQISLLYRLVVLNYLVAIKIMKEEYGKQPGDLYWLSEMVNRSVDYSEKASDHYELEEITSTINMNIKKYFEYFGVRW